MEKSFSTYYSNMTEKIKNLNLRELESKVFRRCSSQVIGIDKKDMLRLVGIAVFKILLIAWLFYNNFLIAIVLLPYIYFYVVAESGEIKKKNRLRKSIEFKDGMQAVSFALEAGYSVENAFVEASAELEKLYSDTDESTTREFKNIVRRINRGDNLEDILWNYGNESGVEDIKYFSEIFRYAKRSGGNIISIIKSTIRNISEKQDITNEIENVISGKKFEAQIMGYVPIIMLIYLRITMPEFVNVLYGNLFGILVMSTCLLVYFIGQKISRKIVDIEV